MSTVDGDLPGHDDMDDGDDMDFVRDLMDKFQAVEDAGHRLAKEAALGILMRIGWTTLLGTDEMKIVISPDYVHRLEGADVAADSLIYLTERCGATYDAETCTLRMPKE